MRKLKTLSIFFIFFFPLINPVQGEEMQKTAERLKIYEMPDGPWDYPQSWDPTEIESNYFQMDYLMKNRMKNFSLKMLVAGVIIGIVSNQFHHQEWIGERENDLAQGVGFYFTSTSMYEFYRYSRAMSQIEFLAAEKGILLPGSHKNDSRRQWYRALEAFKEAQYQKENRTSFTLSFRF